jgi:hypothetical protein
MTKLVVGFVLIFTTLTIYAQQHPAVRIPMTADKWLSPEKSVEYLQYKGTAAIKIISDTANLVLKSYEFTSGTIEFDVESVEPPFTGVYFRRQNKDESEYFYLRVARAGSPLANDAAQYCPVIKGVTIWDMLPYCQGPAIIKKGDWNHIKLVVSGMEMLVYVNDMNRATLQVPRLEGNTRSGTIAFVGKSIFANLVITPGETNGLPATEGFDPTYNDSRYLRNWMVNTPADFPFRKDVGGEDLPNQNTSWDKLTAERRGLVNLSRLFGNSKDRRIVWLKTTINSEKEQIRKLDMGFSDEVWVLINGKLVYVDKNWYGHPIMKEPEGRCSVENTSFSLPLNAGSNELLIGVSNFFYGWGIIARLDKVDGISF